MIRLLPMLLLLLLPATLEAQLKFTTNSGAITITGYSGSGALVIPGVTNGYTVTSIGDSAFKANLLITSVTIPNTVASIGASAFNGCVALSSVNIPDSVTSIGNSAFNTCTILNNVVIGKGVTSIGTYAFYNCLALNRIFFTGNTPASIGSYAFYFYYYSYTLLGKTYTTKTINATVYYMPDTTGWSSTCGDCPAVLWNPSIQSTNANFGIRTNAFGFNITGTANIPIVVAASTDLAGSTWTSLQSCTVTNGSIYFKDPQSTNYGCRFYRIRTP